MQCHCVACLSLACTSSMPLRTPSLSSSFLPLTLGNTLATTRRARGMTAQCRSQAGCRLPINRTGNTTSATVEPHLHARWTVSSFSFPAHRAQPCKRRAVPRRFCAFESAPIRAAGQPGRVLRASPCYRRRRMRRPCPSLIDRMWFAAFDYTTSIAASWNCLPISKAIIGA